MSYRMDTADERVFYNGTLPDPASTGLTILGWFRIRVDTDIFATYWRTSDNGASTIQTCATNTDGLDVNLFTTTGSLDDTYANAVDEWVHVAIVDDGSTVTQYVTPDGGAIVSQSGAVGSGTPAQVCIGGRRSGNAGEPFNGAFAHVRVFAAGLSEAQVEAERDSATAVLTAWADWPLSTGLDLADASGNDRDLTAVAAGATTEEDPPVGGEVTGTAVAALGALTATATGIRTVPGTATAPLGGLTATATGQRTIFGTALATLGALTAVAVQAGAGGTVNTGSWETLLSIVHEAIEERRAELESPPQACPNDGEPLLTGPDGWLYCPFDGWNEKQDPR